ncbi:MAG: UvrD-helicase domain-containing protein [Kiritimatiellia bacterium]|jgi:exodeoxyribonuclease V beta subunit
MNFSEQIFAADFELAGMHLVAASAGTGKTYSIQTLYLRLVLVEGLTVQQILVVTFTKAATKELKERLQKVLREALDYQKGVEEAKEKEEEKEERQEKQEKKKPEERIVRMAELAAAKGIDSKQAISRLTLALLDFDLAAIYTIHGFCKRMLGRFAFETGQPFDVEPTEASDAEIVERCQDWWRTNIVAAGETEVDFSLDELVKLTKRLVSKPDAVNNDDTALTQAAGAVARDYRAGRATSRTVTFDDYLLNLRQALRDDGDAGPLHAALREEFHAALIDEFQDTDPVQWGIFSNLFGSRKEVPCFLVGDPKQAIYRFRNGDIETYVRATQGIPEDARHELDTNYRSEARLIAAVNQIFMDRPRGNTNQTFGHSAIPYQTPLKAKGKEPAESLTVGGAIDERPFKIWLAPFLASRAGIPGSKSDTAHETYRIVAAGIADLLADEAVRIAGELVRPGQIAVLVHQHYEADMIQGELRALGVPSIRQGTGNVWKTDEANELWMFLKTVIDPQDTGSLRGFLITPWIGLSPDDIMALNAGEPVSFPGAGGAALALEDWVARFETWRETWRRRGFPAMFAQATATLGLRARLVALPDGLRRLANIAHLVELVQCEIVQGRKSPEVTLGWIQDQLADSESGGANELRMESDDDAVRIMTVFASKGLQFPVVFAPTLYMLSPKSKRKAFFYEYHDAETGALRITTKKDTGQGAEEKEVDDEHVRHIYVALTRAVHRTVVFTIPPERVGRGGQSLIRLIGDATTAPGKAEDFFGSVTHEPAAVTVVDYTETGPDGKPYQLPEVAVAAPPQMPTIDVSRGHGSFSSLAPRGEAGDASPAAAATEDSAKNRDGETCEEGAVTVVSDDAPPVGIFAFPAGARTGTCWHEIFEDVPFGIADEPLREVVADKLAAYGFLAKAEEAEGRLAATFGMVRRVLDCTLPSENDARGGFALKTIGDADRIAEWEFHFPTPRDRRTSAIKSAVARHERYRAFTDALGNWDRAIPGGYLTGFLDLLFRHDGRYYIIDWKSNRRGGRQSDFDADGVREEMSAHGYWLQFLIYTVAVHQHLKATLPGYDYDRHFGGVYYLFLRGIDGSGDGIYADRPPLALVEELSRILGEFE